MSTGRTVLDNQIRNLFAQSLEESHHSIEMLPQTFAQRFCPIDSDANIVVIVDFEVTKISRFERVDDLTRQMIADFRFSQIEKSSRSCGDRLPIPMQQKFLAIKHW